MSKRYLLNFLLFLIFLSNPWLTDDIFAQSAPDEPINVSLIQLIANPSAYHERVVRVIGYCHLEFEGDAIYLHREDSEKGLTKNGLWLDIEDLTSSNPQELSDRYVLIEGMFDATDKGHMGLFSGCLSDIKRMEYWMSRDEVQKLSEMPDQKK